MLKKLVFGALCLCGAFACSSKPTAKPQEISVQDLLKCFVTAWNRHDAGAMAALWAEDGDLITPWGLWGKGKATVGMIFEKEQAGFFAASTIKQDVNNVRPIGEDGVWVDATSTITGVATPDGNESPPLVQHVVYLVIRQPDGQWRIANARPYTLSGPLKQQKLGN